MGRTKFETVRLNTGASDDEMKRAWERIPDPLRRKLNARELTDYVGRHILPAVRRPAPRNGYAEITRLRDGTHTLEARA